ncbi:MAG TPA: HNH endonuclease domain-containing protein [Phycisphaerae bacterium]|nr:HNH endonuclease domain-containing protein [Phycisphaerae bacterium]
MQKPPLGRRDVPYRSNYQDYKEDLRIDFHYTCAYCTTSENEARGLDFQIDHYLPQSGHPDLKQCYLNLVYSCRHCNRNKSAWDPRLSDWRDDDVLFRSDVLAWGDHFEEDGEVLWAKTPIGVRTDEVLRLNRGSLKRIRELREIRNAASKIINNHLASLKRLGRQLDRLPPHLKGEVLSLPARIERQRKELAAAVATLLDDDAKTPLY